MASKFSSMLKLVLNDSERNNLEIKDTLRTFRLDPTKGNWFEYIIFALFKVDVRDIISIKAQLGKAFGIQPDQLDKMPFWEFEMYVQELEKLVKEENDRQKDEYEKSGVGKAMQMADPKNIGKTTQSMMPKMPKMPTVNISMPKM